MKILYIDFMSHTGHKEWNAKIINILAELSEIDVCVSKGYFEHYKINCSKIIHIPEKYVFETILNKYQKNPLLKILLRYFYIKELKWIFTELQIASYDIVIFSSIDIVTFAFYTKWLNYKVAFLDHEIGSISKNKIKRLAWKYLNPAIKVIVFEEYIKQYLLKRLQLKNEISVLHHTIVSVKELTFSIHQSNNIEFFGPSGSNEVCFIDDILQKEDLIPEKCHVKLKSRTKNVNFKKIDVYDKRIDDEEYYNEINNSDYVLIPYGNSFNYKVSGVLFDALSLKRKVIIIGENTLKNYSNLYPQIVYWYKDSEEFLKHMGMLDKYDPLIIEDFNRFLEDYSDEKIKRELDTLIHSFSKGENHDHN